MGLGDQDQRAAVRRLVDVLSDETMVAGLITVLSEEPTERLQFLGCRLIIAETNPYPRGKQEKLQ